VEEPDSCVDAILTARETRGRASGKEDTVNALDSHAVLTRTKVAAALAILDGRIAISEDDWHLSGVIMAVSDTQRARCQRALQRVKEKENTAKALADADRAVIVEDRIDREKTTKCADAIKRVLRVHGQGDWMPGSKVREKLKSNHREFFEPAVDALALAGEVDVEKIEYRGQSGIRYKIRA